MRLKHLFINESRNHYIFAKGNKFAYSCSVKIHASRFNELLESIFCLLLVVEAFSLQKVVVKMLEEVVCSRCSRLVRGQVNMVDETKLHSPIRSTLAAWIVHCVVDRALSWRRIGPFLMTSASCRHCSFQCISSIC